MDAQVAKVVATPAALELVAQLQAKALHTRSRVFTPQELIALEIGL